MLGALAGLVAGFIHVLSGPDHLAAVAPLAVEGGRRAWLSGAVWGAAHTGGVWLIGLLALLLREVLPLQAVSGWSERLVGVALIAIGLWALRRAARVTVHVHAHAHDGAPHSHIHSHVLADVSHTARLHRHPHVAGAFGLLHGVAGSAHFWGVLPALALPTLTDSLLYLAMFGAGTIIAMSAFAWLLGRLRARFARSGARGMRTLLGATGVAAIAVGILWLVP